MLSKENLVQQITLGFVLVILALLVFTMAVESAGIAGVPGIEGAAELHFNDSAAESTNGPTAIANDCNGGSSGGCGGG